MRQHNGLDNLSKINTKLINLLEQPVKIQAVANSSVDQVFTGWTTISQGNNKIPFYKKQVINKSARVIFGLVQLVIP